MNPRILGLGTALPSQVVTQEQVARFLSRAIEASADLDSCPRLLGFVDRIAPRSGVAQRHCVIGDYALDDPAAYDFYPRRADLEPFPTTAQRLAVFERESVPLAERAARAALAQARVAPEEVTHLVLVTCTGFFAPGPDIALVERLGLRPQTQRAVLGFLGCYAGFNALGLAADIVAGRPEAVVLVVCVELCSLHFQRPLAPDLLVADIIFGDGAAAALIAPAARAGEGLVEILARRSLLVLDAGEPMSWRIGDHGFIMRLSSEVPELLGAALPPFVDALAAGAGLERADLKAWAIHPGGRRILQGAGAALGLDAAALGPSSAVLRRCGNVSSATVFFILETLLAAPAAAPEPIAALGFGPGLTIEGAVFQRL